MDWLPDLVTLDDFGGDWDRYEEAIYGIYCGHWVYGQPARFRERVIRCRQNPTWAGREYAFNKLTSGDDYEEGERLPDLRRCERIGWIRPVIERADTDATRTWSNWRKREFNYLVALPDFSFVVVLSRRQSYWLLKTAYFVEHERRRKQLRSEWTQNRDRAND